MRLFDWALARWRSVTPVPGPRTVFMVEAATLRVAARYVALYTYLENRYASNVVLTFDQMEDLLGFALPARARTDRDWWTSSIRDADRHSDAWTAAHRTATPNMVARTVSFERVP